MLQEFEVGDAVGVFSSFEFSRIVWFFPQRLRRNCVWGGGVRWCVMVGDDDYDDDDDDDNNADDNDYAAQRPDDFMAEMAKSDEHMQEVRVAAAVGGWGLKCSIKHSRRQRCFC